ncbi:hypothetical protein AB0M79_06095 [Polymorphospora sp. NPDC051019]|uniref:ArnT family glycosyltransferase n=1 Tax=Polymorphospora sp. NPDC051019 TaxID=3155725 RepID=UPI00343FDD95
MVTEQALAPAPVTSRRWRPTPVGVALALAVAGVGYRLAVLLAQAPPTNSDEATTGLVALHMSQGREFPLFFYGQHYMGALESYLATPLFLLAGPSVLAVRLPNLLLYTAFLALMWRLTSRLYSPWLAAFTVGLLALGSDRILKNQLVAGGGYPEMNPAGALLMLLAVNLGLGVVRRRTAAYAVFGLVAGLTLWDDWLVLPYVGAAGLLLLVTGWRELRGRPGAALAAGLVVGLVPIVVHNLTAAPEHRSLAVYANLSGGVDASWPDRLFGGVLFGLPMGTGLCDPGRCAPWQLLWGVPAPVLLVVAGVLAWRGLRRAPAGAGYAGPGPRWIVPAGRLALVVAAALTLLAYASSGAAGSTPVESARYLSCLLISLPALLWPLWTLAARGRWRVAGRVTLAALAATMVAATAALVAHLPAYGRQADARAELIAALDERGITRFYGGYWTCLPITLATRERIVCAVIDDDLRPGWDRYGPHRDLVAAAPDPAYVLPAGGPASRAVGAAIAAAGVPSTITTVAGHDIHQPAGRVGLPRR